jgi:hypothetical protein|tara:strand:+ start:444 stop:875 length:432 start_codon:yes stop_codon:yes gene_type:complete
MALKETTPSQTGLKKLPKSVRNTMGYMKSGGVSTKKKAKKKKDTKGIMVVSISVGKLKKKPTKGKKKVYANKGVSVSRDLMANPQKVSSQKINSDSAANRGKSLMAIVSAAIKSNKPTFTYKGKTYNTKLVKDKLNKSKTASA